MKNLVGVTHRVAYATALALAGLLLAVLPAGVRIDPSDLLVKALNLPVAAAGLLVRDQWKTIDLWFGTNALHGAHFSEVLLRHLQIAIPVYVLLFYLPNLFRGLYRWMESRGSAGRPGPSNRSEPEVPAA